MQANEIRVFCPATIANVSCGFDVLGLALDSVGDEMVVRKTQEKRIKITKLTGQDLPTETLQNVAGVAGLALLGTIANSLQSAMHDEKQRLAALVTFVTTASGVVIGGIGSAFWGLVCGLLLHWLLSHKQ